MFTCRRSVIDLDATANNQLYLVAFMCTTFGARLIFTKKTNAGKCCIDICNAEIQCTVIKKLGVIFVLRWFEKLKLAKNSS